MNFTLTGLLLISGWFHFNKIIENNLDTELLYQVFLLQIDDKSFIFRWDLVRFNGNDFNDLHYRYLTLTTKEWNIFPYTVDVQ